jgi:hypothetical protein
MRDDLARLPPLAKLEEQLDVGERYLFLDGVAMVARQGLTSLSELSDLSDGHHTKGTFQRVIDAIGMAAIDWDRVLRMGNGWYDRMAAACRQPAGRDREDAFGKIERDVRKVAAEARDWQHLGLSLAFGLLSLALEVEQAIPISPILPTFPGHAVPQPSQASIREAISEQVGQVFVALLLPTVASVAYAEDRTVMQFEMVATSRSR